MKIKFLILTLFLQLTAFAQTPPLIPPYEFPVNTGSTSGYLFMGFQPVNTTGGLDPSVLLFDASEGHLVFYRTFGADANGDQRLVSDFKLLSNNKMAYYKSIPQPDGNAFNAGKYFLMDGTFTDVDSIGCDGYNTDGHELQLTPSGNYLMLCTQDSTMDLSGLIIDGAQGFPNSTVRAQGIQEVTPAGNEVFYWDPFVENNISDMYDDDWAITYSSSSPLLDWTHCNAIEYDTDGNYLLSSRHFNQLMKIDRTNNDVLWRLGGKRGDFNQSENTFTGQHDVRRLPNGNISIFNNAQFALQRSARPMEFSVDEVNKTVNLADEFIYDSSMVSLAMGCHRKLPGKQTLVCYGGNLDLSSAPLALPEVVVIDSFDNVTLEFNFIQPLAFTYRAQYAASLPFSFNRPTVSISNLPGGRKRLDAGAYTGYRWSTGQTSRRITVLPGSSPEDYFCYVPLGDGFISSDIVSLGGSSKVASTMLNAQGQPLQVSVYPNPGRETVHFRVAGASGDLTFKLLDLQGKILHVGAAKASDEVALDLRALPGGLYFLEVHEIATGKRLRKQIAVQ